MQRTQPGVLSPSSAATPILLLLLAAAAWALLIWQGTGMEMAPVSPTMGMGAALFLATWAVMMAAMMLPAAAPMILVFQRIQSDRRRRGEAFVATWVFVAAYLLVWVATGIAAYACALAAQAIFARAGLAAVTAARIGGCLLIIAGLYQVTPLKDACLAKCRTPVGFIMSSWRDGTVGAIRMGVLHGLYCLGCCWLLFAIMFPLGIMNVAAMAVITLVIVAEKTLPWGRAAARTAGAALVVYGAAVLVAPHLLPTFATPADMATQGDMANMPMPAMPGTRQ